MSKYYGVLEVYKTDIATRDADEYTSGAGPTGMVPCPLVAIYLAGDNEFYLVEDMITDVENDIVAKDRSITNIVIFTTERINSN